MICNIADFIFSSNRLYYKVPSQNQTNVTKISTSVSGHTLEKLTPNTQYVAWVKAHTDAGDSLPSETLLAWTDPAYPAFVEVNQDFLLKTFINIIIKKVCLLERANLRN